MKNDTIHYDWARQSSCNCGVVAQSVLGLNHLQLNDIWVNQVSDGLTANVPAAYLNEGKKIDRTWRNGVKFLCPMTGEPLVEVFKTLFEKGLSKEDIVHLEYMSNVAILEKSGIKSFKTEKIIERKVTGQTITTTKKPHSNFILSLFGKVVEVTETTDIFEEIEVEKKVEDKLYFQNKSNLILYLTAWVEILKSDIKNESQLTENTSVNELEEQLLLATANEDYEYACILRDKINLK